MTELWLKIPTRALQLAHNLGQPLSYAAARGCTRQLYSNIFATTTSYWVRRSVGSLSASCCGHSWGDAARRATFAASGCYGESSLSRKSRASESALPCGGGADARIVSRVRVNAAADVVPCPRPVCVTDPRQNGVLYGTIGFCMERPSELYHICYGTVLAGKKNFPRTKIVNLESKFVWQIVW